MWMIRRDGEVVGRELVFQLAARSTLSDVTPR
jgi:hypothetical protein